MPSGREALMAFLIVGVCCIVGLAVGGIVGNDATAGFGFFAGIAFGIVFARLRALSTRIEALTRDVAGTLPARAAAVAISETRAAPAQPAAATQAPQPASEMRPAPPAPAPIIDSSARRASVAAGAPAPAAPSQTVRTPPPPNAIDPLLAAIRRWFTEGNVPVKVGMLVLFA